MKTLWIKEEYLQQVLDGRKTIEIRVGYANILRLCPGDLLELNGKHRYLIRRVVRYRDFEELLAHEDPARIAPDLELNELLRSLRSLYPPEKEALGVVALEIAAVEPTAGSG